MKIKTLFLFPFFIACISGCSNQPVPVTQNTPVVTDESKATADSTPENINNEDYGDPGFNGFMVENSLVDTSVKKFIANFSAKDLHRILDEKENFILIDIAENSPSRFTFKKGITDLLTIKELLAFVSDSSNRKELHYYNYSPDKCSLLEHFPNGIYFKFYNFKDFITQVEDQLTGVNEEIKNKISQLKDQSGVEFLIKFKKRPDTEIFLNFFTIGKEGKLYLAVIDKRDCGV